MYVCLCHAVTERDIDRAVGTGARELGHLSERLQVATCCGACATSAEEYLKASLQQRAAIETCRQFEREESGLAHAKVA